MRAIIPAVVVLILVLGGLIAYRMTLRSRAQKEQRLDVVFRSSLATETIDKFRNELRLADMAGKHADSFILENILGEYDARLSAWERKGMTQ